MKEEYTDVVGDYTKQVYHLNVNTLPNIDSSEKSILDNKRLTNSQENNRDISNMQKTRRNFISITTNIAIARFQS